MENLNMNSNYKPGKKIEIDSNGEIKKAPAKGKLFADPKYNKLLIVVGIFLAVIIIGMIIFVAVPIPN